MNQHDIIEAYVAQNTPFTPRKSYRSVLLLLASQLSKVIDCDDSPDYNCYVILDPRFKGIFEYVLPSGKTVKFSHKPIYVGKGKGNRHTQHEIEAATSDHVSTKLTALREIAALRLKPIIRVSNKVDEDLAYAFEIDLIAGIGRIGRAGPLTNMTNGGTSLSPSLKGAHSSYLELTDEEFDELQDRRLHPDLSLFCTKSSNIPSLRLQTNSVLDAASSVAKQMRKLWYSRIAELQIQSLTNKVRRSEIRLTTLELNVVSTREIQRTKISTGSDEIGIVESSEGILRVRLCYGWYSRSSIRGDRVRTLRDLIHYKKTTWADLVDAQATRLLSYRSK